MLRGALDRWGGFWVSEDGIALWSLCLCGSLWGQSTLVHPSSPFAYWATLRSQAKCLRTLFSSTGTPGPNASPQKPKSGGVSKGPTFLPAPPCSVSSSSPRLPSLNVLFPGTQHPAERVSFECHRHRHLWAATLTDGIRSRWTRGGADLQ